MQIPQGKVAEQKFLGMITYVAKFKPKLAKKTQLLIELIQEEVALHRTAAHQKGVVDPKQALIEASVLSYYDVQGPVVVPVDASSEGPGACILQNDHANLYKYQRVLLSNANCQHFVRVVVLCVQIQPWNTRFSPYRSVKKWERQSN